ncbi:TRAP transporter large permease subunit [Croceicoccus sediminis]|uniref:TRAP transporter large permease subunit n=1 Tax=Croceicoccus sediminis TaxID=2571150 RepID=UPI00196BA8B5|nr:TRAP transporter large permease subunit [Croceicoccus sediminis]
MTVPIPTALAALVAFIVVIIAWNVLFKRNMGEAMALGLLVTAAFAGTQAPSYLVDGLTGALDHEVLFAALAFVFMAFLIDETGLIGKIIDVLNSAFGRIRGGPAYVATIASAIFGALSGSNSANTAAGGSFTGPWMVRTGWTPARAATVLAGNGGLGAALPPSASMLIMIGFAGELVTTGQVYLALLTAGIYQILHRIVMVRLFIAMDHIPHTSGNTDILPLRTTLKAGLGALSIFLGAIIPIAVTIGPIADYFGRNEAMASALDSISILIWIPVMITTFALIAGRRNLPHSVHGWVDMLGRSMPRFATIGALLYFAIAASEVLGNLGLAADVEMLTRTVPFSALGMLIAVGLLIVIVAGPLSSTATLTAVGQVSLLTLVGIGLDPLAVVVAILVFASTEGASPPASGSIFIAAGLTGAKPEATFIPLIVYYVLPIFAIACLVGIGVLPLLRG